MRVKIIVILLCILFAAGSSYCTTTNFTPKNDKTAKASTSSVSETPKKVEVKKTAVIKTKAETKTTIKKEAAPEAAAPSASTYYSEPRKSAAESSYSTSTNFTPKNVKTGKTSTSKAKAETKTTIREEAAPEAAIASSPQAPSIPTYYSEPNKAMLNENVRYAPAPGTGGGFGIMQEHKIRLKLDTDVTYDDNIYLTKEGKVTDVITRIAPGIFGFIGNDQYTALGFYEADVLIYGKGTANDLTHVNQTLGGSVELFKQSRLKVSVHDTLRPTEDPATSEITPFVKRIANDFGATARYDMSPKTSVSLDYGLGSEYYITDSYKGFNYNQHTISPKFWYHLTPRTSLTGTYTLGLTNYTGGANYNSTYNQGMAGIVGVLTPKSTIGLDAGFQYRSYDNSATKDASGFVMRGIYDYLWSPKTSIQLIGSSDINESVYSSVGYFHSYNLYGSISHHILYNLDLNLNGLYILSVYPHAAIVSGLGEVQRMDNLFGVGGELRYRFRTWMSAYAGYNFRGNVSNAKAFDYNDNMIHGGVKLDF